MVCCMYKVGFCTDERKYTCENNTGNTVDLFKYPKKLFFPTEKSCNKTDG